ncbi:MAG: glucose sorbosone dehydrogenase [Frankiales bacterium]|jgi:glucose/arabinose dehydrogenase|nr:glucose sorbosone dehydrogenase [Frankiales bacterium]
MHRLAVLLTAVVALVTPTATPASAASSPQVVSRGHVQPWGIAFLPDGSALFTERSSRRVWAVTPGRPARVIYTVREAVQRGEGGLLGIAVGPDYARDQRVYLYYTTATDNRVAYVTRGSAARPRVLLDGIPAASTHNGGRLLFGPDGLLYAGTGDAQVRDAAQDPHSLGGKVLRMTKDGRPAPGNPFDTVVLSLGHRNVQGLAFDRSRRLFATEFGQDTYDEVNHVVPGGNYGWPVVEGRSGDTRFRNPVHQWTPSQASPSGMAFRGGSLYVAALRGQRLWRLELDGTTVTRATATYQGTYGRLRAAMVNPRDGAMWLMTGNGTDDRVLRITRFP